MAEYTDEELLDAIRLKMHQDTEYRKQLADAVDSKLSSRLLKLIAQAAEWFFGKVLTGTVEAVISSFLGGG
jgi:hypothetical protein